MLRQFLLASVGSPRVPQQTPALLGGFSFKRVLPPIPQMAAVCDVSVLESSDSMEAAKKLVPGPFYFPSSTYSWLARERVISVRDVVLTHSLVSRFLREGDVIAAYLPEILDEVARRLLFEVEREVPLTDLRSLLLSSHLHLPLLTLDPKQLRNLLETKAEVVWEFELHAERTVLREILSAYKKLLTEVGGLVYELLNNGSSAETIPQKVRAKRNPSMRSLVTSLEELSRGRTNPGRLGFRFLFLDLSGPLRDFMRYRTLQGESLRGVCEKSLCLVVFPCDGSSPPTPPNSSS